METISNFFSTINDRLKSHLYGALIWSFLIANWEIIVAAFTNTSVYGGITNKNAYIHELLDVCVHWDTLIVAPLFFTIIYLFALPWIDLIIYGYREGFRIRKENKKEKLYVKHGIPTTEYLRLRKKLKEAETELQDAIEELEKEAASYSEELSQMETVKSSLKKANKELDQKNTIINTQLQKVSIGGIFPGRWYCKYKFPDQTDYISELFMIDGNDSYCKIPLKLTPSVQFKLTPCFEATAGVQKHG